MNEGQALLGGEGYLVVGGYFLALVAVGIAGRLYRRDDSLGDFYLSSRSLGPFVLFLTLYATQYSGLTLVGFAGNTYRVGLSFLVSVTFGCAVIGGYLMIAPRLQRLSAERKYVTIGDFLQDRFGSTALTLSATAVFIFALASYILSNLKAIGHVVHAATGGAVGFAEGIVALSLLMVAYETLGGMRAVAWTDVLQGLILAVGGVVIFLAIAEHHGSFAESVTLLAKTAPEKWQLPGWRGRLGWTSTVLMVCFGVSIYPHAIQRIYAARDGQVLRRSLQLMLVMPFATTLLMVAIGIIGAARFPGLSRDGSEQIVLVVLQDLVAARPELSLLIVLLVCAMIAAIMSTVDSALLAVSSLVAEDLYARVRPGSSQAKLTRVGKVSSWLLMAAMAYLAVDLPQTLWRLTEIKLEVLCQMAPAVFLGVHLRHITARAVLTGLGLGLGITLCLIGADSLLAAGVARPLGVHAGTWGLLANTAAVLTLSRPGPTRATGPMKAITR